MKLGSNLNEFFADGQDFYDWVGKDTNYLTKNQVGQVYTHEGVSIQITNVDKDIVSFMIVSKEGHGRKSALPIGQQYTIKQFSSREQKIDKFKLFMDDDDGKYYISLLDLRNNKVYTLYSEIKNEKEAEDLMSKCLDVLTTYYQQLQSEEIDIQKIERILNAK